METSKRPSSGLFVVGAAGAAVATTVNVAIYGIGRAAGVAYVVSATSRVRVPDVVLLSLGAFAVGLIAAAFAIRWGRRGLRALQVVGAVLAVVSTWGDFSIDGTASATATLALMHLVVGVAYVASLEIVRSRGQWSTPTTPSLQHAVPR
jgi:hypothetical protein